LRTFRDSLMGLVDKRVTHAAPKRRGGSVIRIHFGGEQALSGEAPARTTGDYTLLVVSLWRLERDGQVIATSEESGKKRRRHMAATWASLASATVERVDVFEPGNDLEVHFSDGTVLVVFPVGTSRHGWIDYTLRTPGIVYRVRSTDIAVQPSQA
jgi:hypothetical protein